MRGPLPTTLVLVLLVLLSIFAPAAPNHVQSAKRGLTALAKGAPVCSLPQAQRRGIVGLKVVRLETRAVEFGRLEAVRITRGDTRDSLLPRPRKCPPPRAVSNADPEAPAPLLVGAFA